MRLSPSQVFSRDTCARMHWYQSIAKVKATSTAANLVFGKCVDVATREYLIAMATGEPLPDPAARFWQLWREGRATTSIVYAATKDPNEFEKMGLDLLKQLPEAWDATGFQVALDQDGKPLIDRRLSMSLGTMFGIDLEYGGIIDVVVYSREGALGPVDVKSAQATHTMLHARRSDQLTSYQMLLDANRDALGLPNVDVVGFWDFLKRRATSRIEPPIMVLRRAASEIAEFRLKLFWTADDIRRGRFPKVSRMQFNSPCESCDFPGHCVDGDSEGLIFPADTHRVTA